MSNWTTDIHQKINITIDPNLNDVRSLEAMTLPQMFHSTVKKFLIILITSGSKLLLFSNCVFFVIL